MSLSNADMQVLHVEVPPRQQCVILVPVGGAIEPACEAGLIELERRGYPVWRVRGYSAIDQARNQLATDALAQGYAETMWIDSDIAFLPDDVDRLRCLELPLVCGIYPKKGKRELAVHVLPGTEQILFGEAGGLVEIKYAATGFLHVRREVYEAVQGKLKLPVCNRQFGGNGMVPFFQPLITGENEGLAGLGTEIKGVRSSSDEKGGSGDDQRRLPQNAAMAITRVFPGPASPALRSSSPWYLAEDFAFCERARQCGFTIWADTRIRLGHVGSYEYCWEDAGAAPKRFASYDYRLA